MVRSYTRVLAALILAGLIGAAQLSAAWAASCGETSVIIGDCFQPTSSITDDRVDLSVDFTVGEDGSEGSTSTRKSNGSGASGRGASAPSNATRPAPAPCPGYAVVNGQVMCDIGYSTPLGGVPATEQNDPTAGRVITLSDIASFRPTAGSQAMEPDGWIVVGLDTNFYASAAQHVRSGILLGQPAEVRFTPVAYRWHYGDGTGRLTSSAGASWATLGAPEFSPTSTSHVYATAGTYTIRLTVHYAPEYRWAGGSWIPINGTVAVAANELMATAGDIRTVLVARDCEASPAGPGC